MLQLLKLLNIYLFCMENNSCLFTLSLTREVGERGRGEGGRGSVVFHGGRGGEGVKVGVVGDGVEGGRA